MAKDRKRREYMESGGVGDVYRGRERFDLGPAGTFERPSATKVLRQSLFRDKQKIREFGAEALIGYEVTAHPNIIATRRIEADSDRTVIVMDLVGPTLEQVRDVDVELTVLDVRAIARGALAGIVHIHSFGLVHGDITSQNIFFGWDGHVKIGDFGRARRATAADIRVDLRRLARIIYELTIGERIFTAADIRLDKIGASDLVDVVDQLLTSDSPAGAARALALLDNRASSPARLRAIAAEIIKPPSDRSWLDLAEQLVKREKESAPFTGRVAVPVVDGERVPPGAGLPTARRDDPAKAISWQRSWVALGAAALLVALAVGYVIGASLPQQQGAKAQLSQEPEPARTVESSATPEGPKPSEAAAQPVGQHPARRDIEPIEPPYQRPTRVRPNLRNNKVLRIDKVGVSQGVTVTLSYGRWIRGDLRLVVRVSNAGEADFLISRASLVDSKGASVRAELGEFFPRLLSPGDISNGTVIIKRAEKLSARALSFVLVDGADHAVRVEGLQW